MGHNLDVVGAPTCQPRNHQALRFANVGALRLSTAPSPTPAATQLVIGAQKRQSHGIALGATYTYSHTIDQRLRRRRRQRRARAELLPARPGVRQRQLRPAPQPHRHLGLRAPLRPQPRVPEQGRHLVQNPRRLLAQRLRSPSPAAQYFTPTYSGNQTEASSGNVYTLRPNRDYTQIDQGPRQARSVLQHRSLLRAGQPDSTAPPRKRLHRRSRARSASTPRSHARSSSPAPTPWSSACRPPTSSTPCSTPVSAPRRTPQTLAR